jgi:hypothetical protein
VPPAGVEAVVKRAMAVLHVPGHERLNGSGLEADGVVGSGDSRSQIQRFRRSRRFLKRVRFQAAPPREDAPDGLEVCRRPLPARGIVGARGSPARYGTRLAAMTRY